MYDKVPTNRNVVEHEKEVEKFWKDHDIFKKSMENRKEGETYTFYDGPPTANGKPPCADPCYQGYDASLSDDEGQDGSEKGRLGYAWTAGRAGS